MTKEELLKEATKESNEAYDLHKKYLKDRKLSKADMELYKSDPQLNIKIGDTVHYMDMPVSYAAGLELLNCFSPFWCAQEKIMFIRKYGNFSISAIECELSHLDKFMEEAKKIDYRDACIYTKFDMHNGRLTHIGHEIRTMYEYLRLKNGYYIDNMIDYEYSIRYKKAINYTMDYTTIPEQDKTKELSIMQSMQLLVCVVHGKYFLFYDYLKAKLKELENETPVLLIDEMNQAPGKVSCRQYALYYYFLWQSGEIEGFKDGEREQWLKDIATEKKINFQNFKTHFAAFFIPKNLIKSTTPNFKDLEITCKMLAVNPNALKQAVAALKSAKDGQM